MSLSGPVRSGFSWPQPRPPSVTVTEADGGEVFWPDMQSSSTLSGDSGSETSITGESFEDLLSHMPKLELIPTPTSGQFVRAKSMPTECQGRDRANSARELSRPNTNRSPEQSRQQKPNTEKHLHPSSATERRKNFAQNAAGSLPALSIKKLAPVRSCSREVRRSRGLSVNSAGELLPVTVLPGLKRTDNKRRRKPRAIVMQAV